MKHLLKWSFAALLAGNALDSASSWGKLEGNPFLGQHQFNGQSVALKFGAAGSLLVVESLYLKKHPKAVTIVNFSLAGGLTAVAVRNYQIQ